MTKFTARGEAMTGQVDRQPSEENRQAVAERTDSDLVEACVALAQALAAFKGGFDADPDDDSAYAFALGAPFQVQAKELLARLTVRPATQAIELAAKARLVPLVLTGNGTISDEVQAFVLRFADDVLALAEGPSERIDAVKRST
ncbi:hypothetical protein [Azorhizobium sp. AG788]|uniref:hypothetical protein n=1 Tax=Azorhizobium sp. AG788 TaxID=2183897 RepID=UPI00105C6351|nr:hypothetical protein [Azorhizobium sp. AG788]